MNKAQLFACAILLSTSLPIHAAVCKDVPQKDEMHSQTVCTYFSSTVADAYHQAKISNETDGKQLRNTLPSERLEEKSADAYVTYAPINHSNYQINLMYDGGETVWTILKLNNKVKIIFDYYPD